MARHLKNDTASEHQGSMKSYIIGFILSLVLTIIPYYMVTRGIGSSNPLVLGVLGFGILQMFVQIFFFLHLGRGPKPLYNVIFFFGTAGMIVLVVGASLLIMDNLYRNMSPAEVTMRMAQEENIAELGGKPTGACQGNRANHTITISSEGVTPGHIEAKRCDTLTFKSGDGAEYELRFGSHHAEVSYGGHYEVAIRSDRAKIITLNEAGDFAFHDHSNHSVMGHFVVHPADD